MTPLQALQEIAKTGDSKSQQIARVALDDQRMQSLAEALYTKVEHEGTVRIGEYIFGFDAGFRYTKGGITAKLLESDCTADRMYDAARVAMFLHAQGYRMTDTGAGCTAWAKTFTDAHVLLTYPGDETAPMDFDHSILISIFDKDDDMILSFEIINLSHLPRFNDGQKI